MNVYDFDHTIYDGDSTIDFYLFCINKYPSIILLAPRYSILYLLCRIGIVNIETAKEYFYKFITKVDNARAIVLEFWELNVGTVGVWYLRQQKPDDIIISASPDFLLQPLCSSWGVYLLASKVDINSGKLLSLNCKGIEKVNRLFEAFPGCIIDEFYSDSKSDLPLARLARKPFIVHRGELRPWQQNNRISKIRSVT
jgi:phosphatidylglycerophosphatase C